MEAHLAPSVFGQAVAVLVRPPLRITGRESVTWRLHHAAAAVTVAGLTIVSTHLNANSGYRRMREATWLAHRYGRRGGPVLISGDMNALSGFALTPPSGRFSIGSRSDPRAVAAFERVGLVDLWKVAGEGSGLTVPTGRGVGDAFDPMRLDYVFGSAAVVPRVRGVRVLRSSEIEYASDHYPVVVELE